MFVEAISTDPPQRIDPSRPFQWRPLHGSMLSLRRRERTDGRSSRRWRPKSKRRRSVGYRGVRPGCDDPGRGYQRCRHPDHLACNHRRKRSFRPDPPMLEIHSLRRPDTDATNRTRSIADTILALAVLLRICGSRHAGLDAIGAEQTRAESVCRSPLWLYYAPPKSAGYFF